MRRQFASERPKPDLEALAASVEYVGSIEHKNYPSFAGPPRLRADASPCDPELGDERELTSWIQDAIRSNFFSEETQGGFPKYVWCERDGIWYEARIVNRDQGQYKGYPISASERPIPN